MWQVRDLKNKRSIILILIFVLLCGCARANKSDENVDPIRVSVILPEQNDAYWFEIQKGIENEIDKLGDDNHADYKIMTPAVAYNEELMMELMRQQIASKVDVLVIPGMENPAITDDLKEAMNEGTKIICIDSDMSGLEGHVYIGTNNTTVGQLMAKHAVEMSGGKALITMVLGEQNNANQQSRLEGFKKEIENYPHMKIRNTVYDQYDGATFMDIYNSNQESTMLVCLEGTGAKVLGTVKLSDKKGYKLVFGFDHTEGVSKGMLDGVMVQDMDAMGRSVVDVVENYAKTGEWETENYYTDIEFVKDNVSLENE